MDAWSWIEQAKKKQHIFKNPDLWIIKKEKRRKQLHVMSFKLAHATPHANIRMSNKIPSLQKLMIFHSFFSVVAVDDDESLVVSSFRRKSSSSGWGWWWLRWPSPGK